MACISHHVCLISVSSPSPFYTADGMALGAAAGLKKLDVEMVIFLAIMLHKVPPPPPIMYLLPSPTSHRLQSPLGSPPSYFTRYSRHLFLTTNINPTFTSHQGYDRTVAKKHLLIFALSAPFTAFLAYFGLSRVSVTLSPQ